MAIKQLLHTSLCVSDPERSIAFYRDVLGFELRRSRRWSGEGPSKVMDVPDAIFTTHVMIHGDFRLELIHFENPASSAATSCPKINELGLSHFTVSVDNATRTIAELERKGVKVRRDTQGSFFAKRPDSMFLFEDPDGFIIEAYEALEGDALPY